VVKAGVGWFVGGVVLLFVVMLIGVFGFGWFQKGTAEFRGDVRETEQVVADPQYRVAAYQEFFQLCTGVQTAEASIAASTDELSRTTDPDRRIQLESNLSAGKTQWANLVNQYNNKAMQDRTQARYFPPNLPPQLGPVYREGMRTTCAV